MIYYRKCNDFKSHKKVYLDICLLHVESWTRYMTFLNLDFLVQEIKWLLGLNEKIYVKPLDQCLLDSKYLVNVG